MRIAGRPVAPAPDRLQRSRRCCDQREADHVSSHEAETPRRWSGPATGSAVPRYAKQQPAASPASQAGLPDAASAGGRKVSTPRRQLFTPTPQLATGSVRLWIGQSGWCLIELDHDSGSLSLTVMLGKRPELYRRGRTTAIRQGLPLGHAGRVGPPTVHSERQFQLCIGETGVCWRRMIGSMGLRASGLSR